MPGRPPAHGAWRQVPSSNKRSSTASRASGRLRKPAVSKRDHILGTRENTSRLQSPANEFLVIETDYPTNYGSNRGRQWSRAELIFHSEVTVHGPFLTHDAAVAAALQRRAYLLNFQEWQLVEPGLFSPNVRATRFACLPSFIFSLSARSID